MAIIKISGFTGENRALQAMLLPETVGTVSLNQKPGRGDLRPWGAPLNMVTVPPGKTTIYRMGRDAPSDVSYWLSWGSEVHVVCAPNAADTAERTYYSGGASFVPQWTDTTLALPNVTNSEPSAHRILGVPAPSLPCVLSASAAADTVAGSFVVDRSYTITSGGSTDWAAIGAVRKVVGADALIYSYAYTIKTVGSTDWVALGASANTVGVSFSKNAIAGSGSGTATQNSYIGVTFTATGVGSGSGTAKSKGTTVTYAYTYTYVTNLMEESAPNPAPASITCLSTDVITVSNLGSAAPLGYPNITLKRIYRTQTGSSGDTAFYRTKSGTDTPIGTASVVDPMDYLGEVMPTTTWLMPPSNLTWLTGLWNGMLAGISGRSVRFCEAFTYYAWPIAYEILPSNAQPVALATFGQTLVVLTNGNPSIVTGGTPDAMDEQPIEFYQACIAPLSAVGIGTGVVWASPDGLAFVGAGGARMLTEGIMTRDDWQALSPSTIQGCYYERRYIGFYIISGVKKAFMIDPHNPQGVYFMDFGADAVYLDDMQDALFILNGIDIQKWDAGASKTVTFKSKVFHQPKPTPAFSCAEVVGDMKPGVMTAFSEVVFGASYTIVSVGNNTNWGNMGLIGAHVAGAVFISTGWVASGNGTFMTTPAEATFKLYADGVLKHTQTVTSKEPFRLPSGYHGSDFQIEVATNCAIQGIAMAHSMAELGTV